MEKEIELHEMSFFNQIDIILNNKLILGQFEDKTFHKILPFLIESFLELYLIILLSKQNLIQKYIV